MVVLSVPVAPPLPATALILAALSVGTSRISGWRNDEELERLIAALQLLGAKISRAEESDEPQAGAGLSSLEVSGRGLGGLMEPDQPLRLTGASLALLMAVLATHPLQTVLTGGNAPTVLLNSLRMLGARIVSRDDLVSEGSSGQSAPPFWIAGPNVAVPLAAALPASGTVAAALMLAALNVPGCSAIDIPAAESGPIAALLAVFGAQIMVSDRGPSELVARLLISGEAELTPADVRLQE